MAEKNKPLKKKYVPTTINAGAQTRDIRSYFIDELIGINEFLKQREMNGQIRDNAKERIRTDRARARAYVCNIGVRALKDRQLEEYEKELAELKRGLMLNPANDDIIVLSPDKVHEVEELEFKFEQLKKGEVSSNGK